jgi:hypothetical protein
MQADQEAGDMTSLRRRVFRSRRRIVVKLTRDERELIRAISLPFAMFPQDLDKFELERVATAVNRFVGDNTSSQIRQHLERRRLWSLITYEDEPFEPFKAVQQLRTTLLDLSAVDDVLFTLK